MKCGDGTSSVLPSETLRFPKRLKLSNKSLIRILCFNIPSWDLSTEAHRVTFSMKRAFINIFPSRECLGLDARTLRVGAGWAPLSFTTAEPLNPLAALHARRARDQTAAVLGSFQVTRCDYQQGVPEIVNVAE